MFDLTKLFLVALTILGFILTGCGKDSAGPAGQPCKAAAQTNDTLVISCPGQDDVVIAGPVGKAGKDGTNGINGAQGPQGLPGQDGIQGPQGISGIDGTDASPVTIVHLCPGVSVYPSTFVEIAFCVDGNLYGTYSANGGFSTELPPGAYNSNGIGSSCNFTILPNCVIQN